MASDINHMLELVETGTIATLTHIDRKDNPHEVTKEQVGLGNADNTSDLDKPVSNATASAITTLRTETHSMINQVNENVGTIVGELNNNIGVITGEINKQILGTQSAVATLREETFSAIGTFKEENKKAHDKITQTTNSMINQLNENIVTVVEGINNNIGVITGEINKQILGTQSAVATLRDETFSAVATLRDETFSAVATLRDDAFKRFNGVYIESGSVDDLKEEGLYLVSQDIAGFPFELMNDWRGYKALIKVVKRQSIVNKQVIIVQYCYISYNCITEIINPIGTRRFVDTGENSKWTGWNNGTPYIDLSRATQVSEETTFSAAQTLIVSEYRGDTIRYLPIKEFTDSLDFDFSKKPEISITAVNTFAVTDSKGNVSQVTREMFYTLPETIITDLDNFLTVGIYKTYVMGNEDWFRPIIQTVGYGLTILQGFFKLEVNFYPNTTSYDYEQIFTYMASILPLQFIRTRTRGTRDAFGDAAPPQWTPWQKQVNHMAVAANEGSIENAKYIMAYSSDGKPISIPIEALIQKAQSGK